MDSIYKRMEEFNSIRKLLQQDIDKVGLQNFFRYCIDQDKRDMVYWMNFFNGIADDGELKCALWDYLPCGDIEVTSDRKLVNRR